MHRHRAARRALVAGLIGVATGTVGGFLVVWQAGPLIGWIAAAIFYLIRVWADVLPQDAAATAEHATFEDDSRVVAEISLLSASLASLVAMGLLLVKAAQEGGLLQAGLTAVAVASVVLAWAVVHTVFNLRYGHLYYAASGGIDFGEDADEPSYRDFAYVAFTIGMTYQVSDTDLTSPAMRSMALRHALLSFLFGTSIIAMMINVVAGLVS